MKTNGINKQKLIDQTSDMFLMDNVNVAPEEEKKLELVLDDVFNSNKSSSVLSDKNILTKYINLKDKKLTKEEWSKIFTKIKYKSGFNNSFSFKSVDQLNVIHEVNHDDVQNEIKTIEKFIGMQESNIESIHKRLNIHFSAQTEKDIRSLVKNNIRETYAQTDGLLDLTQDVIFNIEADWYYNKIYNKIHLDWFVKSPSFKNPDIINKIINDDKNQLDAVQQTHYVEENLFMDLNTIDDVKLFSKTLKAFVANFSSILLEKEIIDQLFVKYINCLLDKSNELNAMTLSILDALILSLTNSPNSKELLAQVKKLHNETLKLTNELSSQLSKYSVLVINNKFVTQTDGLFDVINNFSLLNRNLELLVNQINEYNYSALSKELQKEIDTMQLELGPLPNDKNERYFLQKAYIKKYFIKKAVQNMEEYSSLCTLMDAIKLYANYFINKTNRRKQNKNMAESAFIYENTKQTFANEVKRFRYTTAQVEEFYNEIIDFDKNVFKDNLFSRTNIFFLNETINKLFIILDYIYNSLKISIKRAREVNIKVDIDKKTRRIIHNNLEKSEYYLELLYKQFSVLNNKFDSRNFKNIDICLNTVKNLLVSFSEFVDSSHEFEVFMQFKNLIAQDSEMVKQTLLVFKSMLNVVKEYKNDIHYGLSTLNFISNRLVDKKNKINMEFSSIDGDLHDCKECKEKHSRKQFETTLLLDYKKNSIQFKSQIKKVINDALRTRKNNVYSLDAQKFIFNKLMEVISIENGISKQLSFVANAVGAQISSIMLKNIFNRSTYILEATNNNIVSNSLEKYAEILTNHLLILKFSAVRLLVLKNLQYHLFLLEKLKDEIRTFVPEFNDFNSLLKFNLEKIHDLSILIKDARKESSYKDDRRMNYLYCEFVKAGFLPEVRNIDKTQEVIHRLFPDAFANGIFAGKNKVNVPINNNDQEDIEVTYFDNKNPTKNPVSYHELLKFAKVDFLDDIKVVDPFEFDDALLSKKDNYLDHNADSIGVVNGSFKDLLETSKAKDDFMCGVVDLYEVKDVWKPSDFEMTMPKYTPQPSTPIRKGGFGFAKKAEKIENK